MSELETKPIIMFDMDGTLLDLAFDDFIWNHKLPERHASTHQCSLQHSLDTLYAFYQEHKHTLSWYSSRYWTAKVEVDTLKLQQDYQDKIRPRPGCFELLQALKDQGYRCWLLTNADCAGLKLKLENIPLEPYFELMISSEEIGYAKEFVEFWQILQQKHPFNPDHAVLVDDTAPVLHGAERFGIAHLVTIRQPSSDQPERNAQDLDYPSINHLTELLPLLDQLSIQVQHVKTA